MLTFGALAVSASTAKADEEGCRCKPSKCSDADQDCYMLSCSDGTSKICDGRYNQT